LSFDSPTIKYVHPLVFIASLVMAADKVAERMRAKLEGSHAPGPLQLVDYGRWPGAPSRNPNRQEHPRRFRTALAAAELDEKPDLNKTRQRSITPDAYARN
jgi:hypothetical protein